MSTRTATLVIVCAMESGPQGPGRPVEVHHQEIGIAESLPDVFAIMERAGIADYDLIWRGGDSSSWE